jgi:ABC-type proline/glycine betaine transport system ATPase subunit
VEHDMGVVFGLADKIAVVVYGEVLAFDTPDAVRANRLVQEAYLGSSVAQAQAPELSASASRVESEPRLDSCHRGWEATSSACSSRQTTEEFWRLTAHRLDANSAGTI